jgi:hypothetical protein
MRAVFWIVLAFVIVLVLGLMMFVVSNIGKAGGSRATTPGRAQFDAANRKITRYEGAAAFGNTPEAKAIAEAYSANLKLATESSFTGGKRGSVSFTKGRVLTYCELRDDSCVLLVHVPELRQYKDDARDELAKLAWQTAETTLSEEGVDRRVKLAVALRGALLYGPVMMGEIDPSDRPSGATFTGNGMNAMERIYPLFAPEPASSAPTTMPATAPAP